MEAKEKVSFIHSITAKIMLMVVVMVALSLMVCISIANVRASATVNNVCLLYTSDAILFVGSVRCV